MSKGHYIEKMIFINLFKKKLAQVTILLYVHELTTVILWKLFEFNEKKSTLSGLFSCLSLK